MEIQSSVNNQFIPMSMEELENVDGGILITIGTVTLVLTAKGIAMGIGAVTAAYAAGRAIGEGLAYILK